MAVWRWGVVAVLLVAGGCSTRPPTEVIREQPTIPAPDTILSQPLDGGAGAGLGVTPDAGAAGTTAPDTILITQQSGLVERLPNTCKLENYQQFQGQPASILASAVIDRPWREVRPDAIVTQEYNPGRLNFHTNAAGVIQRIACG
jgi:hypothetical protein